MITWFESIDNGMTIAVVYGAICMLPVLAISMLLKRGKFNPAKYFVNFLFFVYMCCVMAVVFLPLPSAGNMPCGFRIQTIPGYCLYDMARNPKISVIAQVLFNIVMTIPFGAYLTYYWKMDVKKVIGFSFALTVFIEFGQLTGLFFLYPGSYRCCDVDDLILNTMGGLIGALVTRQCHFLPELDQFERVLLQMNRRHA